MDDTVIIDNRRGHIEWTECDECIFVFNLFVNKEYRGRHYPKLMFDILKKHYGKPKCVIENEGTTIKVIDYENSEIRQIVPERHVFMGNTYFYGKIVSLMGNNFKNGNSMKAMMKMMMMSQMLGGENNFFDGMLDDVNFGVTDSDDNDNSDDNEEED